jgi:hypothetical protein
MQQRHTRAHRKHEHGCANARHLTHPHAQLAFSFHDMTHTAPHLLHVVLPLLQLPIVAVI